MTYLHSPNNIVYAYTTLICGLPKAPNLEELEKKLASKILVPSFRNQSSLTPQLTNPGNIFHPFLSELSALVSTLRSLFKSKKILLVRSLFITQIG